jgi:hypothetical protein
MNKGEVLVVSIVAPDEGVGEVESVPLPEREVVVECGGRRIQGTIRIGTPDGQGRVLDFMNQPEPFVCLHDLERQHLVHKRRITKVVEVHRD